MKEELNMGNLDGKRKREKHYGKILWLMLMGILLWEICMPYAYGKSGYASWYSEESCEREGTSGIMANGEVFNEEAMVCASWDYKFGTALSVESIHTKRKVIVKVCDRGPSKRLYRMGRIIDLSKGAFRKIAPLEQGIIKVEVKEINQ